MLEKIFGRRRPRRVYVVIGDTQRTYVLVDGKYIPKENILSVDTANRKVVYIDYDGSIRVADMEEHGSAERQRREAGKREAPRIEVVG